MENNNLFDFELVKDENCWCVKGYHGMGEEVVFPASYKNKPVKYIMCSISPKQKKKIKRVIIPEGYTYIYDTFSDCKKLTNIELPEGLTRIGDGAFSGCTGLTNIKLPKNLAFIGEQVFEGCKNLKGINYE